MTFYPSSIPTFPNQTNKIDLADAVLINTMCGEINAIALELGTNPAGTATDLTQRLARCIADNGAMRQGTAFPGSPNDGDFFYRTDENVMYVNNGSTWDAQGQSLSNLAFCFSGAPFSTATISGFVYSTSLTPAMNGTNVANYSFWGVYGTAFRTVIKTKLKRLSGENTLTVHSLIWQNTATGDFAVAQVVVDPAGANVAQSVWSDTNQVTPQWKSFSLSLTGLTVGTTYDVDINLKQTPTGTASAYLGAIVGVLS